MQATARVTLKSFHVPASRNEWMKPPTTVDAFYTPQLNAISEINVFILINITYFFFLAVPAAILQSPFYDINAPK